METNDDGDADSYELGLRQKDARRSFMLGIVLVILSGVVFTAWFVIVQAIVAANPDARIRTGFLGMGVFFGVLGVGSIVQGFRKRSAARAFEEGLRGQRRS